MTDPRTYTVKQCEPAYAKKSGAAIGNATSSRRDFFNSVGKIGDLAVLNSVQGGTIGKGLRNLASISTSIRTGCGSLPTMIGTTLDTGANWVLEQTGIAPTVVQAVQGFNPGVANQAYSQAKNVFTQVKSGDFKASNIPAVLQDFQNLERLGRHIFTPGASDVQTSLGEHCEASPYAVDLIARAPKYKFLFIVQFIPDRGYGPLGSNDFGPLDMAFTVKKSTRPNTKYVTEDVNYYNFRSKAVVKTEFEDMSMSFHDDQLNFATQFYKAYSRAMSPITGIESAESDYLEQSGMSFVNKTLVQQEILGQIPASTYAASKGTLADDRKQIFKEIRLYHVFDAGHRMNVYRFLNPRISQLSLDDVDMSIGNEGSELSIVFNYDSVFIDADVSMKDNGGKYNIKQTQRGAVYPLRYNDGATTEAPSNAGISPTGTPTSGTVSCDPLQQTNNSSILSSIGKAATSAAADLADKFSNPFG